MKKINDISNLSTLITYHRYMFSKDQAEILFKNIAIPEYIALEEIKDSLENGKVYLKVISDNMKISISKASKIVTSLKEKGLVPDAVAGLSLGEYTAMCYSGILSIEDTNSLITKRAKIMSEALENSDSGMTAIMFYDKEKVKEMVTKQMIETFGWDEGYCGVKVEVIDAP